MDILERITTLLSEVTDEVYYVFKPDGIPIDDYLVFCFDIKDDWSMTPKELLDLFFPIIFFVNVSS